MSTPNPTPARDAVEAAADEVYSVSYELYSKGLGDGHPLGGSYGREYEGLKADLREAVTALIAAARADEQAQWAVADRARIIREVVEKLPGIAAPEADFIAVEWFTEAGRFPYRVAMPRAALLDALLGADERAQLAARATDQERDAVASETSRAGEPFHD